MSGLFGDKTFKKYTEGEINIMINKVKGILDRYVPSKINMPYFKKRKDIIDIITYLLEFLQKNSNIKRRVIFYCIYSLLSRTLHLFEDHDRFLESVKEKIAETKRDDANLDLSPFVSHSPDVIPTLKAFLGKQKYSYIVKTSLLEAVEENDFTRLKLLEKRINKNNVYMLFEKQFTIQFNNYDIFKFTLDVLKKYDRHYIFLKRIFTKFSLQYEHFIILQNLGYDLKKIMNRNSCLAMNTVENLCNLKNEVENVMYRDERNELVNKDVLGIILEYVSL